MGPTVEVVSTDGFETQKEQIRRILVKALRYLGKENVLLEVALMSEKQMRGINKRWRGMDESANVLSFVESKEFPQVPGEPVPLGELYLSPRTIERKEEDISRLAVHGLLHLLGYTHKTKRDTMKMEQIENKLWQTLSQD